MAMERDDAVAKFEENARASGALLKQVDEMELSNEKLQRELKDAKEVNNGVRLCPHPSDGVG